MSGGGEFKKVFFQHFMCGLYFLKQNLLKVLRTKGCPLNEH